MRNNIIPIFTSNYSIGKSILTLDEPSVPIEDNKPTSIFSIAKQHKLESIYILDHSFAGFIDAYTNSKKNNIDLRFGIKFLLTNDMLQKDEASFETESYVNIWILNTNGYKDLIKIFTHAATNGFYYVPRLDWKNLNDLLTENLAVSIPFYDSFLFNNNLKGYSTIPILPKNTLFHVEDKKLPFDPLIKELVEKYCAEEKFEMINSSTCYYYKKADIDAYTTFRCMTNPFRRTLLTEPNLDHFSSDLFCFEHYLDLIK